MRAVVRNPAFVTLTGFVSSRIQAGSTELRWQESTESTDPTDAVLAGHRRAEMGLPRQSVLLPNTPNISEAQLVQTPFGRLCPPSEASER